MEVHGGTIIAELQETPSIVHKSMVPPQVEGIVSKVVKDGAYTVTRCAGSGPARRRQ